MILSKQGGALKKGFVNLFSERHRMPRWQKQNQMSCGHLVEIAASGRLENILKIYD